MSGVLRYIMSTVSPQRFPPVPLISDEKMRAVTMATHGPPEVLVYSEDVFAPKIDPRTKQIAIEIAGAGLNPVDFKMRKGPISDIIYPKPKIPGCDVAGRVLAVGEDSSFQIGDKVFVMLPLLGSNFGGYASICCVDESIVAPAPSTIPLVHAAAFPLVACTVIQGLRPVKQAFLGDLRGKKCFISAGSGGVGTFAVQYCSKVLGMHVVTSASPRNFDLLRNLGAAEVLDYHSQPLEEHVRDFDVMIDTLGYLNEDKVFQSNSRVLNPSHSHYIRIASSPYGDTLTNMAGGFSGDFFGLAVPEARVDRLITGFWHHFVSRVLYSVGRPGIQYHFVLVAPERDALLEVKDAVEKGLIRPVIQEMFPLQEASKAHTILESGHVTGKLILKVNDAL